MVGDFQDYSLLTLAIEMRKHFTEAATEKSSSNLCLATIIKIIWKRLSSSQIFKVAQMNGFLGTFQGFSSQL